MTQLKKYNLDGKSMKEIELKEEQLSATANPKMLKDYIVAIRSNQRQWSANTKGRTEVNHSNKKPHRQKGTGRARQGTLAAPQYKGGGVVFGPKPKFDQSVRINKKERQKIIRSLICQKIAENNCIVLSDTDMDSPQTKRLSKFLHACGIEKRVLFIAEQAEQTTAALKASKEPMTSRKHFNLQLSLRNLPKAEFSFIDCVNGYQLIKASKIIMTEKSLKNFLEQN